MDNRKSLSELISVESLEAIEAWLAKYPSDYRRSAAIAALRIVQEEKNHLTNELMEAVAHYIGLEPISVYELATFYSLYHLEPVGRHRVDICTNISCMLTGSDDVVNHFEERLGVKLGETTEDGKVTLRAVECLGACVGAPMCQVDKTYHENLTPERIDQILDNLR